MGEKLAAVFVDYSAAFDTVSHKFVDTDLQARNGCIEQGVRNVQGNLQCRVNLHDSERG